MQNIFGSRLSQGLPIVNGWLSIPSAYCADVMARAGWDSLTVDLQHGVQDYASLVQCFYGARHSHTPMMARVPSLDTGMIGKVLDAGAWGVICPMVNSAQEAERLVRACLYPPAGARSNGPNLAAAYGRPGAAYQSFANDELLVLPMIETAAAVTALEEILDVPGVSGVYVGPSDLAFSYGKSPAFDTEDQELRAIYKAAVRAAKLRGKIAGIHCISHDYAAQMVAEGFQLVTINSDAGLLRAAASHAVRSLREHVGERP